MFLNRVSYYCARSPFAPVAILAYCALCSLAQSEPATAQVKLRPVHLLALQQTKYRLRPGEVAPVAASRETLDFIRNAKSLVARVNGISGAGFVLEPSAKDDQVLLAASVTMKPGDYTVSLSAVGETGEERVMTLNVTLDPMQAESLGAATPPEELRNGWQAEIVSTQALIAQGWVVPGAFERIPPALQTEVQSQLVLGNTYDSLDTPVVEKHLDAQ